ncbi:MAG: hypothetical protein H6R24_210 [Proteobacteria bacterium]|jgi:hypothetical protein|nr:hypothetical protein [Pseudomonadota bacterium]
MPHLHYPPLAVLAHDIEPSPVGKVVLVVLIGDESDRYPFARLFPD